MKDFRELLDDERNSFAFTRIFKRIIIGDYELSIQASKTHYCIPSKTLIDLYQYENMEVTVFKNKEWINVEEDSFFDNWKERDKFLKWYDGRVAPYIPIQMIQSLCDYIEEKSND